MGRTARVLAAALGVVMLVTGIALWFRADHPFDVQGHRGARGLLPENTMPAFTYADDLGVTTLEMDTKVTRDGVLVVTHDSTLNPDLVRDSSGRWVAEGIPVNSLTLAQIEELDVGRLRPGTAYAERLPEQQSIDGTRIPTLREVLDTFRDRSDVRLSIETKIEPDHPDWSPAPSEFARKLVDEVRSAGLEKRSMIESFDWRTLKEVRRIAPEIPTVALTVADTTLLRDGRWTAGLRLDDYGGSVPALVAASGANIWSPDSKMLTAESVREAHDRGLAVVPWTVDKPADLEAMRALGVNGVISDYPKQALDVAPRVIPRWQPFVLLAVGAALLIAAALPLRRRNGGIAT